MKLIGKQAPDFYCEALINGEIKTIESHNLLGEYSVLFFYPLDFTFVCPTELHALQEKLEQFQSRGVTVYGISVDSVHTHRAWRETPRNKGGIAGTTYPLLSDINKTIARDFGVLCEPDGVAFRGTFILDKQNIIQHATINNLPLGRNIDEIIRMIDAIQFVDQHGDQVCPANWETGKDTLAADADSVAKYLSE